MDHGKATGEWLAWLEKYAQRIESERGKWSADIYTERENAAKGANPRFVLRQWVLEEVIMKADKRVLAKVLHVGV